MKYLLWHSLCYFLDARNHLRYRNIQATKTVTVIVVNYTIMDTKSMCPNASMTLNTQNTKSDKW